MKNIKSIPFLDKLRGFQKSAIRWMDYKNGIGLFADPMGSGKTIEAIGYLALYPELRPVLVIMPATVKLKWEKEIKKWLPEDTPQVIDGNKQFEVTGSIILINWDIIYKGKNVFNPKFALGSSKKEYIKKYWARDELLETDWKVVVGDEIHKISNSKAARTIAFKQICRKKKKIMALSGTPLENRPIDFYNILRILDPKTFGNWYDFTMLYCGRKHNGFGFTYTGSSKTEELHQKVKSIMLRREKHIILPDLPPLQRTIIPVKIDNRNEYRKVQNNYIRWLTSKEGAESAAIANNALHLSRIESLKQLAVEGILNSVMKWIEDYLESGEKLVVGCIHRDINDILYKKFSKISTQLIGGMSNAKKESAIFKFQNNPKTKLIICNIIAAAEGIDLYAANSTLTIEYLWKPGPHDQFENRVHRIGQKADSVNAYYLIGVDTVMEDIAELIDKKRMIIDAVIDGKETSEESLFIELLSKMKGGK